MMLNADESNATTIDLTQNWQIVRMDDGTLWLRYLTLKEDLSQGNLLFCISDECTLDAEELQKGVNFLRSKGMQTTFPN